ncbi:AAA family ATPase [Sphaerisporangium perillae]|uniref:AAA family ATPase n=1 Tax=Sphaerisporangium perillae TaxID=2935860 RepID=UPI0020104029|nr:SMC family ATPase [Sphaerisporangium perillae]
MRPVRLHMDNFGSFREPVTVDFADVDYFALVGATGAGKSTVIDAICFALYGTVPRWGKENVIAHALAPSATAGKVALVFESSGRRHAVVRAVRRDAKGKVHTKEARIDELDPAVPATAELAELLEAVIRPVAEGEAVTAEVQRITGLEYKFFTQCVVLPQGRFAEFLHAQPRERQDLLVQLLGAEVYDQIRERAGREEAVARQSAAFARDRLAKLSDADEAAERAATDRLTSLRAFTAQIRADVDSLRAGDETLRKAREERAAAAQRLAPLDALAMPGDAPALAATLRQVGNEVKARADEVSRLEAEEQRAHEDLAALGDKAALTAHLTAFDDHDRLSADLARANAEAERAQADLRRLGAEAEKCATALADAEQEWNRLRDAHAAAELAQRLSVGEPCPTCLRPVTELPHHPALSDLETARRAVDAARKQAEQGRTRHGKAETQATVATRRADELGESLAALSLSGDRDEIASRLGTIHEAEDAVTQARQAMKAARSRLAEVQRRADEAGRKAEQSWRDLDAARDTVVALGAPPLDRDDLHRAWTELLAWRDRAAESRRSAMAVHDEELTQMERRQDGERVLLLKRLVDHEISIDSEPTPDAIAETVVKAVTRAETLVERVRENRRLATELTEQATEKDQEARVAHELAQLLRADAFERWLCSEALELLVAAASDTLRELSDGQYELALGGRNEIEVVDHAEAGMRRNVRTLSGGETFQAALALALALSEQVAGLAAAASRSLDSIFLDEGFGTLDPATLDTVATTLERLAISRERMVGLVTHVPALADRVPVRFEVTRDTRGSHLRKAAS